jgi:PTS system galactitol-specific IIB component
MVKEKNVLIVCGTGVATSTVVKERLGESLPERGINIGTIDKAKATEAPGKSTSGKYDMIVTTTSLNQDRYELPIYHTTAFMTGIGQDEAIKDIAEQLKSG